MTIEIEQAAEWRREFTAWWNSQDVEGLSCSYQFAAWNAWRECCSRLLAWERGQKEPVAWELEALSAKLHDVYQQEAERQGDVRHARAYEALPENIKDYDRALAKWILIEYTAPSHTDLMISPEAIAKMDMPDTTPAAPSQDERDAKQLKDIALLLSDGMFCMDENDMGGAYKNFKQIRDILDAAMSEREGS